jgi:hypothetical protein
MGDETKVPGAGFTECDSLTTDDPLQQGDVFEWLGPEPPWRRFGIVITADCDLFFEKHSGILSYVPVIPLTEYLTLFHLPKRFEEHRQPVIEELVVAVRKHQAAAHPEFPEPISEQAILRWVERDGPIGMIDQLGVVDHVERSRIVKLAEDYRSAVHAAATGTFDEQVGALTRLREHRSKKAAKVTWNEISSLVKRLPGDAFFIGTLAVAHESGYVAYLRLVRDVRQDEVAVRQSDLGRGSTKARRIARLRSPFIYALTQQLGAVFSSIGLPTPYEDNRSRLVSVLESGRGGE